MSGVSFHRWHACARACRGRKQGGMVKFLWESKRRLTDVG